MYFILLVLLVLATNSVSCLNITVDNDHVLYPNEIQDVFVTKCLPGLGCYYTGPPWYHPLYRPISVPPQNNINITYCLYTQDNPKKFFNLDPELRNIRGSPYRRRKPITVIVHGYSQDFTSQLEIKDAWLEYEDRNIILVDWSEPGGPPYYQACANARAVGVMIAKTLKRLRAYGRIRSADIHVIGKSLGGQLVAYIGQNIYKLGRITGLDPGGPYFHNAPHSVRLDRGDAVFVDNIFSNYGTNIYNGEAYDGPTGHADFYPNGGNHQPGCDFDQFLNLTVTMDKDRVGNECSHDGSQRYFASSIRQCRYNATACFSYQGYKNGICDKQVTNRMGLFATKPKYPRRYFIDTEADAPYCEVK